MFLPQTQLIIITRPNYEGLQLDMADANLEGVACALIRGVAYNQVCSLDSTVEAAEDQDSLEGVLLLDWQLFHHQIALARLWQLRNITIRPKEMLVKC